MRPTQRRSGGRHSAPVGESRIDSLIQQRRKEAGIVNNNSVANKGGNDYFENPFNGLPREKLADNAVGPDELGPGAVLNGNIGEQINATKLPNIGGLNGDLPQDELPNIPDSKLPNIPKTKLPGDVLYSPFGFGAITGKVDGGRIERRSIPSDRLHNVHGSKLTGDSSIPWKLIDVHGVVFTHRLEKRLAEERRKSDRKYARKP